MKLFVTLWNDEAGFVVSSELILIATLVVIGLIGGLTTVRDQVIGELADVADAFASINNSYSFAAISAHSGSTAGTVFSDLEDFCDAAAVAGSFPHCITTVAGSAE